MYADGDCLWRLGTAWGALQIDISGVNVTSDMDNWRLVVFFYHVDNYDAFETVADKIELLACSSVDGMSFDGMTDVERFVFPVQNETVSASAQHLVNASGWTDTQVFVCADDEDAATETLTFAGSMEVRNPYGLLPAVLYGMLPFSGLLTVGYLVLDVFFAFLLIRHRRQLLSLHSGILLILVMGTVASTVWFYAFYRMNKTGEPVCCPYPTTFLVAVILDVRAALVRTLARIILLVVCLGYGIVRSHLSKAEVTVVTLLSLCYFVSGVADEITRGTSSGADFREKPTAWSFIQLLCNLTFIMWIQYSMERIMRELRDQKQFAKLGMYRSLAWSLAAFIVFFTILTVVAVCSRLGVFEWDVEWEWMQLVAWPVLNFTVSAAMCFIWRPTKNSSQFAYSIQLPMTDDGTGLEMTRNTRHSSSDEDENPEMESESDDEDIQAPTTETKKKSDSKDSDDMEGV
ncbi:hypothetical protein BBJ28_00001929 [Nothophytophthora sp. Chile5]|nr:hypothetical protein BBJ28_00001929 [Nothophytophthora sp. Chile5]